MKIKVCNSIFPHFLNLSYVNLTFLTKLFICESSNLTDLLLQRSFIKYVKFQMLTLENMENRIWILVEKLARYVNTLNLQELANPAADWISSRCWKEIQALEVLPKFKGFVKYFSTSLEKFKRIFDSVEPETWDFNWEWK